MSISHSIEIVRAAQSERGAHRVDAFSQLPLAASPSVHCPRCGEQIAAPDGTLKAYVQNNFGSTEYVKLVIHHKGGGSGKNPPPFPPHVHRL